jgi:hypothetical protein
VQAMALQNLLMSEPLQPLILQFLNVGDFTKIAKQIVGEIVACIGGYHRKIMQPKKEQNRILYRTKEHSAASYRINRLW